MSPQRSSTPSFGCALFGLTALALLIVIGAVIAIAIPAQVIETFGQPSPQLSPLQQATLFWQIWQQRQHLITPFNPPGSEQIFRVELGESVTSVTARLQQQGLIAEAAALRAYLVYRGLDVSLQAGEYPLSSGMTAVEMAHTMQDATPTNVLFNVLAGWRMEEIAAALPTSGLAIAPDEFLQAARRFPGGHAFSDGLTPASTAEGYLSPGSYELPRASQADDLLQALLSAFDANDAVRQGFLHQGLSLHEGVILASIIEREAILDEEMPLIASVFHNRLAAGMNLAADPTVQYALGYNTAQQTWWTNPLSLADLEVASPYNTYRNPGLPPGPICNPGQAALQAAANPDDSPYYYFRAACDGAGRHNFAATFAEHQANACP